MARLTVVTTPELASGFRLAGAVTVAADSGPAAEAVLGPMLAEAEPGVVAVDESLLDAVDPELRRRLEDAVTLVLVGLPSGSDAGGEGERRARLAELLRRVVGHHVTFRGER